MNPPPLPRRRNPVAAFFVGLWDVMNFTRRLILNLLFFGLLFLILLSFVIAIGRSGGTPLQERTTLVLAPEGRLVEQFTADPVSRALSKALGGQDAGEVQLRDLLRTIEAARNDSNIERVLLRLDGLQPSGYASLRELATALAGLRDAGKQVVAFSEGLGQGQYLLAAQADEVYLDPMGSLLLEGMASYRQYFRQGLQEKLGVDVHLFRVGEYKSAAEPYILDAASEESKAADLYWMNDIWARYLQDVASARKLDAAQLATAINDLPAGIEAAGGEEWAYVPSPAPLVGEVPVVVSVGERGSGSRLVARPAAGTPIDATLSFDLPPARQGPWVIWLPREPLQSLQVHGLDAQGRAWASVQDGFFSPTAGDAFAAGGYAVVLPEGLAGPQRLGLVVRTPLRAAPTPRVVPIAGALRLTAREMAFASALYAAWTTLLIASLALYWAVREGLFLAHAAYALAALAFMAMLQGHLYAIPGTGALAAMGMRGFWLAVLLFNLCGLWLVLAFVEAGASRSRLVRRMPVGAFSPPSTITWAVLSS